MADRTFRHTAPDDKFWTEDTVRKLGVDIGGRGVPDEDWWVKVDIGGGHGVQAHPNPRHVLSGMGAVQTALNTAIRSEVWLARKAGMSWAEVGESLGITRQAAQQRFGR